MSFQYLLLFGRAWVSNSSDIRRFESIGVVVSVEWDCRRPTISRTRNQYGEIPNLGLACEVFDRSAVGENELEAGAGHAGGEEEE